MGDHHRPGLAVADQVGIGVQDRVDVAFGGGAVAVARIHGASRLSKVGSIDRTGEGTARGSWVMAFTSATAYDCGRLLFSVVSRR